MTGILVLGVAEVGESLTRSHTRLHRKFKTGLSYIMRPCFKSTFSWGEKEFDLNLTLYVCVCIHGTPFAYFFLCINYKIFCCFLGQDVLYPSLALDLFC